MREHLKENSVVYALITLLTVGGGTAALTNNLPVSQREFKAHLAQYNQVEEELEDIGEDVDELLLNQLRQSLRQAYKDKCEASDPQAIDYILAEIRDLQDSYIEITGRRFQPPPCEE